MQYLTYLHVVIYYIIGYSMSKDSNIKYHPLYNKYEDLDGVIIYKNHLTTSIVKKIFSDIKMKVFKYFYYQFFEKLIIEII